MLHLAQKASTNKEIKEHDQVHDYNILNLIDTPSIHKKKHIS